MGEMVCDIFIGTKESAFVYSLAAAAVAYSVTQACSIGRLDVCGCGRTPKMKLKNKNWMWGGCSDNIAYGVRFSNKFTYAVERKRMMGRQKIAMRRAIMNIHNNEAGRLVSFLSHAQLVVFIFFPGFFKSVICPDTGANYTQWKGLDL